MLLTFALLTAFFPSNWPLLSLPVTQVIHSLYWASSPAALQELHSINSVGGEQSWSSKIKDASEIVKNVITAAGIAVGGLWTWLLFIRKREKFPRADLSHKLTHRQVGNAHRLLHLEVNVSNTGGILLSLISGKAWVQQILPPPDDFMEALRKSEDPVKQGETQYAWPLLAERESNWEKGRIEVEPGESHQISYDFVIDSEAETIEVYTYFKNAKKRKREIGWDLTTLYDLKSDSHESQIATLSTSGPGTKEKHK